MIGSEKPFVICQAYGDEAAYPPDETIELLVAIHSPYGRHVVLEKPLSQKQLRSGSKDRELTLEVPQQGVTFADLVFLCDHRAEAAIEFQRTGTSRPLALDPRKAGSRGSYPEGS